MEPDAPACRNCRFWRQPVKWHEDRQHCLRFPPEKGAVYISDHHHAYWQEARWPITKADDWCGEHQFSPPQPT